MDAVCPFVGELFDTALSDLSSGFHPDSPLGSSIGSDFLMPESFFAQCKDGRAMERPSQMRNRISIYGVLALALCLQSCATISVKERVDGIGWKAPGHLEWWNDSLPTVIMLPRICKGTHSEFLIPGPEPRIALRLDLENATAVFHDDRLSCIENEPVSEDSLRLVVSRAPIPMGSADSVVLLGRLEKNGRDSYAYSLGKNDGFGRYSDNTCSDSSWCMRDGAVIRYRTNGRVHFLMVQEHLHPEASPWARRKRLEASLGYLISVPVDILLSPIYLIGFGILSWSLRDFSLGA
jgi:hypothetical protein